MRKPKRKPRVVVGPSVRDEINMLHADLQRCYDKIREEERARLELDDRLNARIRALMFFLDCHEDYVPVQPGYWVILKGRNGNMKDAPVLT